MFFVTDPEKSS